MKSEESGHVYMYKRKPTSTATCTKGGKVYIIIVHKTKQSSTGSYFGPLVFVPGFFLAAGLSVGGGDACVGFFAGGGVVGALVACVGGGVVGGSVASVGGVLVVACVGGSVASVGGRGGSVGDGPISLTLAGVDLTT